MVDYSGSYAIPRLDLGESLWEYRQGQPMWVGTQMLPVLNTQKQGATFSAITRATILQNPDTKRGARGTYNRINLGAKDKIYQCKNFGLEGSVDDSERLLYASDFDHEMATAEVVERAVGLAQERRIASLLFNATTWTGSALFTDRSGDPWSAAGASIIAHVIAAMRKVKAQTGMTPDTLIVSEVTLEDMLQNTEILARFPGHSGPITRAMIESAMASIFGLKRLVVGGEVYNSAAENEAQTATPTDVWSSSYAMVAVTCAPGASLRTPCVGRTWLWTPYSANLFTVETYREEQSESEIIRVKNFVNEQVFDAAFAHLIQVR